MLIVGAQPLPNQQLQAALGGQAVTLNLYQLAYGLFCDVLVNGSAIITGVICLNLTRIVRNAYLGFSGDFVFYDTQGTDDPIYTGIGSRFQLVYLEASDLAAAGLSG
jgi:hypothetical protein